MKQKEFRKFDIDLPAQPIINERPWMLAGLVFAFTVLIIAAFAYLRIN